MTVRSVKQSPSTCSFHLPLICTSGHCNKVTKTVTGCQMQNYLVKKKLVWTDVVEPVAPRHFIRLLMYMDQIKACLSA